MYRTVNVLHRICGLTIMSNGKDVLVVAWGAGAIWAEVQEVGGVYLVCYRALNKRQA